MRIYGYFNRFKKFAAIGAAGIMLQLPASCQLEDFTTSTTTTLEGREVVSYFARSWIVTPIERWLDDRIDALFDELDGD